MWTFAGVACALFIAHESGHVMATRLLGGRWLGVAWHGPLVGVRLSLDGLSPRQVALTLMCGPLAETLCAAVALAIWPSRLPWWLMLLAVEWLANLAPWGFVSNDGTRLWRLWRTGMVH